MKRRFLQWEDIVITVIIGLQTETDGENAKNKDTKQQKDLNLAENGNRNWTPRYIVPRDFLIL